MLDNFDRALLLAAALSVAGVDGACWEHGQDECPCQWNYQYGYCEETCSGLSEEECSDACEWVDSSQNCQTACSEYTEDWACDGSYCSWSYEDGVCEAGCEAKYGDEDECGEHPCRNQIFNPTSMWA